MSSQPSRAVGIRVHGSPIESSLMDLSSQNEARADSDWLEVSARYSPDQLCFRERDKAVPRFTRKVLVFYFADVVWPNQSTSPSPVLASSCRLATRCPPSGCRRPSFDIHRLIAANSTLSLRVRPSRCDVPKPPSPSLRSDRCRGLPLHCTVWGRLNDVRRTKIASVDGCRPCGVQCVERERTWKAFPAVEKVDTL
jgi:hypothetical protein